MSRTAVQDLIDQYQHAFRILYEEIGRFGDADWTQGFSYFQTPVKQAMHIFDCLDFYSRENMGEYPWGHRFGGGWWELPDDRLPDKAAVVVYARELEERIVGQLTPLSDEDLLKASGDADDWVKTAVGHHIYALKHTMHHHGQLAALSVYHGHEGGSWD